MDYKCVLCVLFISVSSQNAFHTAAQTTTGSTTKAASTFTTTTTSDATTVSPGFVNLPAWVDVLESTVPRAVVVEFQIQSSDPVPKLQILSVKPSAAVFEDPIINPTDTSSIFTVQIFLNDSVDHETVRLYTVQLGIMTAAGPVKQSFNLRVINVNEPPLCEPQFQIPGAEVRVPEDTLPFVPLYRVLANDPDENDTITFSISQVQPANSLGQFSIDDVGQITSNQSFNYHKGPKEFSLSVVVKDRAGANCSGTVRMKVLKVLTDSIDFTFPVQNVSIFENQGAEDFVASVQANPNISSVFYTFVRSYPHYKIGRDDGIIRTAYNLDLESDRTLTQSVLLVRAFSVSEGRTGTATVTINVLDVNEHHPFCFPSVIVLTVAESTEVGRSLSAVSCIDVDVSNTNVTLTLIENSLSLFKFRLENGQLQVNNSLDYDTEEAAFNHFQYEATVLAMDSGIPTLTTEIQILITVTPVNEFDPQFVGPVVLPVPEDARRGDVIGVVSAVDRDWPFHSLRLSIQGGDSGFTIDPVGGQVYLGTELDFEERRTYMVKVQAVDFDQDVDQTFHRTGAADIIIQVQNVNDNAPVCDPVSYKSLIYSTLAADVPILTLSCTDPDDDVLTATITNGAVVDRFQMNGLSLTSKNLFSYVPDGVYDDTVFEVTIQVSDGKYGTGVVAFITVVPWTTTEPTPKISTTMRPPEVVTVISGFWDPEPWFVVLVTVTGALVLLALSLITWAALTRTLVCGTKDMSEPLLNDFCAGVNRDGTENPSGSDDKVSLDGSVSLSKVSIQEDVMRFDGKAQDPVSGRSYLFNSETGQRRWLEPQLPV